MSYDKFNVITNNFNKIEDINYDSIIKNYIENYFESEINIYHPDYLYQLVWNNKVNINKITELYNNSIDEYLIHLKQNIRHTIKKDNFSLNSLNQLITKFNFKISKLLNILQLKDTSNKIFIEKLLSDPILISFIESETENINYETISEIKLLCSIIKSLSNEYTWFLKLIGNSLKNNIPLFNYNIPQIYKSLYELNYIITYITNIKNIYKFVNEDIQSLTQPLTELLKNKVFEIIPQCSFNDLLNLINNSLKKIIIIVKDDNFIAEVKKNITLYFSTNTISPEFIDIENGQFYEFLHVLSISKKENFVDSYFLLLLQNEKINSILLDIINNNINTNIIFIKNIIQLLTNIKNKDIFIDKYHKLLVKRLLSGQTDFNNEKDVINELIMTFGKKITFKVEKVINDFISSNDNVKNYTTNISFDNITTSYSNWDINYSQGYVEISSTLLTKPDNNFTKLLSNYDSYYDKIYSNKRKLIWLLQYGEVNVIFLNSIELKLLPIQLLVLEIFEYTDLVKLDKIKESSFFNNYSIKFRDSIINSLIIGGLLILTDNQLKLSNCVNIATNYIDIFINNSDKESVFIDTKAEIAHNREDIIKSIINHYLKISAKNKLELYDLVSRNIKLFELNEELFIKSINSLIKFDYIKYENNLYTKLVY
jgi:hypothetical protein